MGNVVRQQVTVVFSGLTCFVGELDDFVVEAWVNSCITERIAMQQIVTSADIERQLGRFSNNTGGQDSDHKQGTCFA